MMNNLETDVLIVGSGIAGLYSALNLNENLSITIITKGSVEECNTYLAQGGISVCKSRYDVDSFIKDTINAGMGLNNKEAVRVLVEESTENIEVLDKMGVPFNKVEGYFEYTKEGAHVKNRIVHCEDLTGRRVFETLYEKVKEKPNVKIIDHSELFELYIENDICKGGYFIYDKYVYIAKSSYVILATGGVGGLFKNSTNQPILTGDGMGLAGRHNVELDSMEYIQFHPTALFVKNSKDKRRFLISESMRGEGALLYNSLGNRFVDELKPRNVVTEAIYKELKKTDSECVYLDITHISSQYLKKRFPLIYEGCLKYGIDITKDRIPVTPSQHYMMGGIAVDLYSRTKVDRLYACGECSCTGVHGGNRLASNSLLEGLVFSKRAAQDINNKFNREKNSNHKEKDITYGEALDISKKNSDYVAGVILNLRKDLKDEMVGYR